MSCLEVSTSRTELLSYMLILFVCTSTHSIHSMYDFPLLAFSSIWSARPYYPTSDQAPSRVAIALIISVSSLASFCASAVDLSIVRATAR